MKPIAIEKMTREQLRALPFGKARTFELPAARDIINATSLIYNVRIAKGLHIEEAEIQKESICCSETSQGC